MTIFKERIQPTYTTAEVNALIVEHFEETFYDIYEIIINGSKYIAEKIGEYNGAPIVQVPIIHEGIRAEKPFVLYQGKLEALFNPEVSEIRSQFIAEESIDAANKLDTQNIVDQCKKFASTYVDVIKVDESVSEYINDNTATIYEKLDQTKQTIVDEFITFSNKLEQHADNLISDRTAQIHDNLNEQLELNSVRLQQHIDAETGRAYNNIRSDLLDTIDTVFSNKLSEEIFEEFKKQRIEIDTKQVELNHALRNGFKELSAQSNATIADTLLEYKERFSKSIDEFSKQIYEKLDTEIAKVTQDQNSSTKLLVDECKQLLLGKITEEITNVQLNIQEIITERKALAQQPVDFSQIKKQFEKNIEDRFATELTNLKRYISLSSGGGSGSARSSGGGTGDVVWGDIGGDITSQLDLSNELNALSSNITALETQINSILVNISSLQSSISSLQQDVSSLQQSVTSTVASSNGSLTIDIGDGVNLIRETTFSYLIMPYNATLNSWRIVSDASGVLVVDIKKSPYTLFPSTTSIVNSNYISLSNQQTNTSAITGWTTTSLLSTDVIHCIVNTASNIRKATISIKLTK